MQFFFYNVMYFYLWLIDFGKICGTGIIHCYVHERNVILKSLNAKSYWTNTSNMTRLYRF